MGARRCQGATRDGIAINPNADRPGFTRAWQRFVGNPTGSWAPGIGWFSAKPASRKFWRKNSTH
jgi:hypothetical protein